MFKPRRLKTTTQMWFT